MNPIARLLVAAALVLTPTARAVPVYLLTQDNMLVTMDSAAPAAASAPDAITGRGTFDIVGIDIRTTRQTIAPANPGVGSLWALGFNDVSHEAQVFVINPATAVATPVGPVLTGMVDPDGDNGWFFGHDPGKDRFRIMNANKNYEFNPNTGAFVEQTALAGTPNVNGSAFATVSFGQASRVYFLNQSPNDRLCSSTTIASGTFGSVNFSGVSFTLGAGLDIFGNLTLLAATDGVAKLFSVNRSTGAATEIGPINGNPMIRAITIAPTSFPPRLAVTIRTLGPKRLVTTRPAVRVRGTAESSAGIKRIDYRIGNARPKKANGTVRWNASVRVKRGQNNVAFRATGQNDVVSKPSIVRIRRR